MDWEILILSKLHDIIAKDEEFWKQRSCSIWLKSGECNTKFFHMSTLKHREINYIQFIKFNGRTFQKDEDIMQAAMDLFSSLLYNDHPLDPACQNDIPHLVSVDMNHFLTRIVTTKKVCVVVFSFQGNKMLGLDGFPMFLFQIYWDILENNVVSAAKEFFSSRSLLKELNSSKLGLIPFRIFV